MILLNGKEIEFGTFPNGETHLETVISTQEIAVDINHISFKYENDGDLIKLMFLKSYMDTLLFGNRCELTIYYMPYSRMDRSESGSAFTLKYIANMINDMMFDIVYVIEPHSDVTCALLDNSIAVMVNEDYLTAVMNEVDFDLAEDFVMYPDAGAQKRYAKMFGGNQLVGYKHRDFETGHITDFQLVGEGEGPHKVIIVDDLCSKGGTFLMAAEALKARGFTEIYLIVAHCEESIFEGQIFNESSSITKVFTTDTILSKDSLTWTRAQYKDRLEITPIQDLLTHV